jgi:hypothetical protein
VHDRSQQEGGYRTGVGHHREQVGQPGHDLRADRPAQLGRRDDVASGEYVDPGEHLARHLRPERRHRVDLAADPQRPLDHRIGHRTGPDVVQLVPVALQRGAGDRGPQADLGRDRPAGAPQRGMAQCPVHRRAGRVERGSHLDQVKYGRQESCR